MPGTMKRLCCFLVLLLGFAACRPRAPRPLALWREPVTGMAFIYLPPGHFIMGSPPNEIGRGADEALHEVKLSRGCWMGRMEVTQGEWQRIMGATEPHPDKPSPFRAFDPKLPVVAVSYEDVARFLERLGAQSPGSRFRLPTEAEWEYACRAGTTTPFATGEHLSGRQAQVADSAIGVPTRPSPVGSYPANAWGLYDFHGNVWEWTCDWYGPYPAGPVVDPQGPRSGDLKVIRGGSWYFGTESARSALRYTHAPKDWGFSLGFRVVREDR